MQSTLQIELRKQGIMFLYKLQKIKTYYVGGRIRLSSTYLKETLSMQFDTEEIH
jgi:hypothetical protein